MILKVRKFNFKALVEQAQLGQLNPKEIKRHIKIAKDFGKPLVADQLKVCLILPNHVVINQEIPSDMRERAAKGIIYLNNLGHTLARTKQMLHKHGLVETVNRNAARRGVSKNLQILSDAGLIELSSEAIALDYPNYFDLKAVKAAAYKLSLISKRP